GPGCRLLRGADLLPAPVVVEALFRLAGRGSGDLLLLRFPPQPSGPPGERAEPHRLAVQLVHQRLDTRLLARIGSTEIRGRVVEHGAAILRMMAEAIGRGPRLQRAHASLVGQRLRSMLPGVGPPGLPQP